MSEDLSPRAASVKLSKALTQLDVVHPHSLREPLANILRAGIEICTISGSLLGGAINHALAVAEALRQAAEPIYDQPHAFTLNSRTDRCVCGRIWVDDMHSDSLAKLTY